MDEANKIIGQSYLIKEEIIKSNKENVRYVRNLVTETVLNSRYTTNRFQLTHTPFSNGCALQHIKTMV